MCIESIVERSFGIVKGWKPREEEKFYLILRLGTVIPSTEGSVIRKKLNAFVCLLVPGQRPMTKKPYLVQNTKKSVFVSYDDSVVVTAVGIASHRSKVHF